MIFKSNFPQHRHHLIGLQGPPRHHMHKLEEVLLSIINPALVSDVYNLVQNVVRDAVLDIVQTDCYLCFEVNFGEIQVAEVQQRHKLLVLASCEDEAVFGLVEQVDQVTVRIVIAFGIAQVEHQVQ